MIAYILGGIGLFLLGIVLLTEGMRTAAGEALRKVLLRFTGGRMKAFLSGAGVTALVQSSSATILTTIGFVSAGLLAFPQAVGVIVGAAVGTTSTGWLVSVLGLKFTISTLALPLVGVGALMRLLGRGRTAALGLALAGFGLIFVGIDTLQGGMEELATRLDPADLPGDTVLDRLVLVLVGAGMTVIMQSSSAAVATTLAALHSGTVDLGQAATLVIGQNAGAAVTAAMASIGASVPARRTAYSHVMFNTATSAVAFLVLPVFVMLAGRADPGRGVDGAIAIAAFHTGFNLLGAALVLPFAGRFAGFVARLVPDRGPVLTRYLDATVVNVAPVAVEAARRTASEVARVVFAATRRMLTERAVRPDVRVDLAAAVAALGETRRFLGMVRTAPDRPDEYARHVSVLHAVDHLDRMVDALRDEAPLRTIAGDDDLRRQALALAPALAAATAWLSGAVADAPVVLVRDTSAAAASTRREQRPHVMARTAAGAVDADTALHQLDAMRWLDRLGYHVWRTVFHLSEPDARAGESAGSEAFPESEPPES